jgi:hypothetical protein
MNLKIDLNNIKYKILYKIAIEHGVFVIIKRIN